MKTYYQCEKCGKRFSTPEEATECEQKHEEERVRYETLKAEKESRAKKIEELITSYVQDYNSLPSFKWFWYML